MVDHPFPHKYNILFQLEHCLNAQHVLVLRLLLFDQVDLFLALDENQHHFAFNFAEGQRFGFVVVEPFGNKILDYSFDGSGVVVGDGPPERNAEIGVQVDLQIFFDDA